MPKIEFLECNSGPAKTVDVPDGGELVDICDDSLAPVPFSCRSAACATCHIEILEGAEFIEPLTEEEEELLDVIGGEPGTRLACQARIKAGEGLIKIRSIAQ